MTTVLVAGGTGEAGRAAVAELLGRGHDVRVLSRHGGTPVPGSHPVAADLVSGSGLADALAGVDVVVDTTDGKSRRARPVLTTGAANLLAAAEAVGVARTVLLSIVNVDRGPLAYYRAKAEQERRYRAARLDTRIVRATQFHSFVPMLCAPAARVGLLPAFTHTAFQPIDVRDVARALADASDAPALADITDGVAQAPEVVGGPEILPMQDIVRQWKSAAGVRGVVAPIRIPGGLGRFWRAGENLVPEHRDGAITFAQWLAEQPRH